MLPAFGGFDIWHLSRVFEQDVLLLNYVSSLGYQERAHVNAQKSHFTFMLGELCFPSRVTAVGDPLIFSKNLLRFFYNPSVTEFLDSSGPAG